MAVQRCRIDHGAGRDVVSLELLDPMGEIEARTLAEVGEVIAEAEARARGGAYVAGFVGYDAAPAFDPAFELPGRDGNLPLAWFGAFASSRPAPPLAAIRRRRSPSWSLDLDQGQHARGVAAVQAAIAEGDVYLVNYTTRLRRPWLAEDDLAELYAALVAGYDGGYHALIETEAWAVACGSPELFFERRAGRVSTRPMKGTAARGRWSEEDEELASRLSASPKEQAENVMVVDLLRNDLGKVARPGSTTVPAIAKLERHPSLWQLTSSVGATLRDDVGLAELFGALFPCASVTGAPKISAMATIAQLEDRPRGLYCGAVGLLTPGVPEPEACFAVAIRSAVVDKRRGEVSYGSGGGITADSDAGVEWAELRLKAASLEQARPAHLDGALGLIETMRFDPASGQGIVNLSRHLARLRASARYLGLAVPEGLEAQLLAFSHGLVEASRIRLVLRTEGLALEAEALDDLGGVVLLGVDLEAVDSRDPGLFHKTTDRRRYELRTARHPEVDDVVLINERGEVTETARANLAVLIDGDWCTPPLSAGLLPGVERARLLEEGRILERVVSLEAFEQAEAVATFSSLRGWRSAKLAGQPSPRSRAVAAQHQGGGR